MSFEAAMRAAGLFPRDVVADGKWRRCPTEHKPRKKNGCYMLTVDGRRGYFKDYALHGEWNTWDDGRPVSYAERISHEARMREMRVQEMARRRVALRSMREYFAGLPRLAGEHPYLTNKGLTMRGCERLRVDGDRLVIPMYVNEALMSLQTIDPAGAKLYRAGCPVGGASLRLERQGATVTCFAEGFATGLALFQCLPRSRVIVCFDAGNLVKVAKASTVRGLAVVCADNDHTGTVNTGVERGEQAAEALGCGLAYPEGIAGSDWADAFAEWGNNAAKVNAAVMRQATYVASG